MTISDALLAMARTDELRDGTEARAIIVAALHRRLLEDPNSFWDAYFEMLSALDPSPFRVLAEKLLRGGAVHGMTTIADLPAILEADAAGE